MIKNQIAKVLEDITGIKNPQVEFSSNEEFGDYSSNIALKNKDLNIKDLVDKINRLDLPFIASFLGKFINFKLKNDVLIDNLIQIDSQKEDYGKSNLGDGKLAIIEYSSPNIAKPFGVGHLRSTVIGDAIANLTEAIGYKVMRDNHVGDWGTQFGKVICAIKKWGDVDKIEKSDDPVEELVKLYVKYHEASKIDSKLDDEARFWFKKLEDGDKEAKNLWQKCVDWSWVEFDKVYELLGIRFDKNFNNGKGLGESFFEARMKTVIDELEDKKLLKVGEGGAKLVFFTSTLGGLKLPPAMILKKDGATLYHTRDLATDKYRLEKYAPDIIINEVGSEQSLYFKQLFEIEKILGWYKESQRVHVGHGLYMMDGKKMSTRAGKTVKLEEVLTEAIEKAKTLGNKNEKVAKQVGIGAIKYFDLSHQPMTNISFDWDKMFAMDGNSSPYIQYTFARTQSVIAKARNTKNEIRNVSNFDIDISNLNNEETLLLRSLCRFSEVISSAAKTYSPNILCNYLYELASKFNTFYARYKILQPERTKNKVLSLNKYRILVDSEQSTEYSNNEKHGSQFTVDSSQSEFRLLLTSAVAQVLKNGLKLLGIEAPERM